MSDYVLVPKEPSIAQMEAAKVYGDNCAQIYRAMLAAAPSAWRDIAEAPKDLTHADLWVIYSNDGETTTHACRFADSYLYRGVWRDRGGNEIEWGLTGPRFSDGELDPAWRKITHFMFPPPIPGREEEMSNGSE